MLRDRSGRRFYDAHAYAQAVATVDAAQRVVSAAHHPLSLDFVAYRTPFSLLSAEEIARDAGDGRDPFREYFRELALGEQALPRLEVRVDRQDLDVVRA